MAASPTQAHRSSWSVATRIYVRYRGRRQAESARRLAAARVRICPIRHLVTTM